jgi:hypothetical protein
VLALGGSRRALLAQNVKKAYAGFDSGSALGGPEESYCPEAKYSPCTTLLGGEKIVWVEMISN